MHIRHSITQASYRTVNYQRNTDVQKAQCFSGPGRDSAFIRRYDLSCKRVEDEGSDGDESAEGGRQLIAAKLEK